MKKICSFIAVCASLTLSSVGMSQNGIDSVISLQQFDPGKFNVICADGSKSSVTKSDILEGSVCLQVVAPITLNNGLFTSSTLSCPQRVATLIENNLLKAVDLTWTCSGVTNRFVCDESQAVCDTTYQGTHVSITISSNATYTYKGLDGNNYEFAWSSSRDARPTQALSTASKADGTMN
jgi:hypothetical protein